MRMAVRVRQKGFCSVHGFEPKRLQVLQRKVQVAMESLNQINEEGKDVTQKLVKAYRHIK